MPVCATSEQPQTTKPWPLGAQTTRTVLSLASCVEPFCFFSVSLNSSTFSVLGWVKVGGGKTHLRST